MTSVLPHFLALRIEWCRDRGRYLRWDEEVLCLIVEMTRTIHYFTTRASWWRILGDRRTVHDPVLQSGLHAYAQRQAAIMERMIGKCEVLWSSVSNTMSTYWHVPDDE